MPPVKEKKEKAGTKKPTNGKAPPRKVTKAAEPAATGELLYPELDKRLCVGDDALTATAAKEILGYEVERPATSEDKGTSFGEDFMGLDYYGRKFRCTRNVANRPFVPAKMREYGQKILQRQWRLNGETGVIGKTGRVLSFQHRGTGLIWAEDEYLDPKRRAHWEINWPDGPPTMECILIFGVDEAPETTRTIDTGKPRDISDALCVEAFQDVPAGKRKDVCRVAEVAIRRLWDRTGASKDPWAPTICNEEALQFFSNHQPHLGSDLKDGGLSALSHVLQENKDGGVSQYLSPGNAAAFCYLMGCSGTAGIRDGTNQLHEYAEGGRRESAGLTWDYWQMACNFWAEVHAGKALTKHLNAVRRPLPGHDKKGADPGSYVFVKGGSGGSVAEKINVLLKAWHLYKENKRITSEALELTYDCEWLDDGTLDSCTMAGSSTQALGGIDCYEEAGGELLADGGDADLAPDADEVERLKEEVQAERLKPDEPANGVLRLPVVNEGNQQLEQLEFIHQQVPNTLLLFRTPTGYQAFHEDARILARHKVAVKVDPQVKMVAKVLSANWPALHAKLVEAGQQIAVAVRVDDEMVVSAYAE